MATATEPRATEPGGASAGLDTILTDAARGPLRRMLPGRAAVKLAGKLALRPTAVVRRSAGMGAELGRIAIGRSDVEPPRRDRRFGDEAWRSNPAFRRLVQTYLAAGRTVDGLICDADLDWRSERQVRFAAE